MVQWSHIKQAFNLLKSNYTYQLYITYSTWVGYFSSLNFNVINLISGLLLLNMDLCTYFSFLLERPLFSPWQNPYILQNSVYMSSPLRSLPWMSPSWHSQSIFCNFSYHFVSTSILALFLLHYIYVSTSVLHQILSFWRDKPISHLSSYYVCLARSLFQIVSSQ